MPPPAHEEPGRGPADGSPPDGGHDDPDGALAQTIAAVRDAEVGVARLGDLWPSEGLVRRIADRVLRAAFERDFRPLDAFRVPRPSDGPAGHDPHATLYPTRASWRVLDPDEPAAPSGGTARDVAAALAREGVLFAAAQALAEEVRTGRDGGDGRDALALARVGVPLDVLAMRLGLAPEVVDAPQAAAARVRAALNATPHDSHGPRDPRDAAYDASSARRAADALARAHPATTAPRWSTPGFGARARTDDASAPVPTLGLVALARTSDPYGTGDGGALDHALDLIAAAGAMGLRTIVLTHDLAAAGRALADPRAAHGVGLVQWPCPPAQFVRDAVLPLVAPDAVPTLLLPRFPSRGEIGTPLACAEWLGWRTVGAMGGIDAAFADAAATPVRFARSWLHVQGGDVVTLHSPEGTIALVGEATRARAVALGVDAACAPEAIATALGVSRVVVVSAPAFHVDAILAADVPGSDPRLAPAVVLADAVLAASVVVRACAEPLRRSGVLSSAQARALTDAAGPAPSRDACARVAHLAAPIFDAGLARSVASALDPTAPDLGAAALARLRHAVDQIVAVHPPAHVEHGPTRAYWASLRRGVGDLESVAGVLRDHGIAVRRVPGGLGARGVPTLNRVLAPTAVGLACVMPTLASTTASGQRARVGAMRALDEVLAAACLPDMGGCVRRLAARASESSLREGAARCSFVCF
jgi:hypothetical protein